MFRRVWGKLVIEDVGDKVAEHLLGSNPQATQLAVGVRGGTQTAGIITHALRDANPEHATLQIDVKNAFNELDRTAMLNAAKNFGPHLFSFATALYANGAQSLAYFMEGARRETIQCDTGVTQGCGLGTLLFALAFHKCITTELEIDQAKDEQEFGEIFVCAYADDATITGPNKQILTFAERLAKRLERDASLKVKENIWLPAQDATQQRKLYELKKTLSACYFSFLRGGFIESDLRLARSAACVTP